MRRVPAAQLALWPWTRPKRKPKHRKAIGPRSLDAAAVDAMRVLWAVQRVPARRLATLYQVGKSTVIRVITTGRPDVPAASWSPWAYLLAPWPVLALEAVQADLQAGRRPGARLTRKLSHQAVQRVRELVATGLTQAAVAERFGVNQSTVSDAVRRGSYGYVAASDVEVADLTVRGRLEHPEHPDPVDTGTGRIVSPDGQVHEHVRAAEVATGVDRMDIASALASGLGGWRYEPGDAPQHAELLWGTSPDIATRRRR